MKAVKNNKSIPIQFFNEVSPLLKSIVSHYWYVKGNQNEKATHALLPMNHVDLIVNMGHSFSYGEEKRNNHLNSIHFHGIKETSLKVTQHGKVQAFGISFTPWGFYFLAKKSMSKYANSIVNLSEVNHLLEEELSDYIESFTEQSNFIAQIESSLIKVINIKNKEEYDCKIIESFIASNSSNIKKYCKDTKISIKKLERIFIKYIGVSPKRFLNIIRFEESARDVMYKHEISFTEIAHKNGYYDQSHFVKEFRVFTDYTPSNFRSDKPAIKSHFNCE
ncbi:MAG: AraC family transcriptional regulator [Clostridiales bacterium]|nr:AraC family transcriptional regulator [Clostridiales bacterium]